MKEITTLISSADEKRFTEFEKTAKEMLSQKVATSLQTAGYFDRLLSAKCSIDENAGTYKEFMAKKLKKFGVKSPTELEGADKKKFFDEVDAEWDGKDEKPEAGDK